MSFDQFASADDASAPRARPSPAPPPETEEDLFDFDEQGEREAPSAATGVELDGALAAVESAAQDLAQDIAPLAPAPPSRAPGVAARPATAGAPPVAVKPVSIKPVSAPRPSLAPSLGTTVVHQRLSMSPLAAALLATVVLVNVTLMAFSWRSIQAVKQMVVDVSHEVADTTSELRSESARRNQVAAFQSEPIFGALPEGYRTLEIAKQRMESGEHARARRMLYGLLAVVDRIDQPARGEVEAQAGFLIADSYRLEAQSLLGGERGQQ